MGGEEIWEEGEMEMMQERIRRLDVQQEEKVEKDKHYDETCEDTRHLIEEVDVSPFYLPDEPDHFPLFYILLFFLLPGSVNYLANT